MAAARSRIVIALVALGIVVVACLAGDHGAARAAVGQATGPLIASDRPDAAVLVAQGMKPGESRSGEVTVTNVGDSAGAFALAGSGLSDSAARLSTMLGLTVQDVTPGRPQSQVYAGPISGLSAVALGTLQQGESRHYRFTVNVAARADNAYQGVATTMSFVWSTTGVGAPPAAPSPAPTPAPKPPANPAAVPRATLSAPARQSGKSGSVGAWVTCEATCNAILTGAAVDGSTTLPMRAVRRTLNGPMRMRMRIKLPARARAGIADDRVIPVRLRLKAAIGTHVVVVRRTIRVGITHP